jgi:hypothetical protein
LAAICADQFVMALFDRGLAPAALPTPIAIVARRSFFAMRPLR